MTNFHSGQLKSGAWLLEASGLTVSKWFTAYDPSALTGVPEDEKHRQDDQQDQQITSSRWFLADDDDPDRDDKPQDPAPTGQPTTTVAPNSTNTTQYGPNGATATDPHATPAAEAHPGAHIGPGAWNNWMGAGGGSGGSVGGSGVSNGGGGHAIGNPSGGPPSQSLTEALTRAGIDPSMHPLISGFSATEGNNPSGVPTLGFKDTQAGTTLDQHAQALAKQIQDRQSVAGSFPAAGTPHDQASWMATVVGQNGVPSDFAGERQPARSDYVNRVVNSMPTPAAPGVAGIGG